MAPKKRRNERAKKAGQLDLFDQIDRYVIVRQEIVEQCEKTSNETTSYASEHEDCIEIAAAIKRAIRESGLSRAQVCDAINDYWSRTKEGHTAGQCKKPLSYEMFNHHLSKPVEYPVKAYFLFAIQKVTGSLEPARAIVAPAGAEVASQEDIAMMALGKLDKNITEMQQLKRQLKNKGLGR
ncbi:MAG: hypothetical protein KAV87_53655 [Desulfobacteraceae bacterium]|nr:hypothetical protein [Desulfobacteraceae bacterium]